MAQHLELIFFYRTPKDLGSKPPLASSLQSLESSFLSLSLRRYPTAFISCVSALEGALKAAFHPTPQRTLEALITHAQVHTPVLQLFPRSELDAFRRKRNQLVHNGFMTTDIEESCQLLLQTGYPFLSQCYKELFDFSLEETLESGTYRLFAGAHQIFEKVKSRPDVKFHHCFSGLAHHIMWNMKDSFGSYAENLSAQMADEQGYKFEIMQREKELCEQEFGASWRLDCPVCGFYESFICQLNRNELTQGNFDWIQGYCVNCGFTSPKEAPLLIEILCATQIQEDRSRILEDFGLS